MTDFNDLQRIISDNEDIPILIDPGDEMVSLYELVMEFDVGEIRKPRHQRDKVWGQSKRDDWIERIKNKKLGAPIGVIVTYQLNDGSPSPRWLNDGYQRVSATLEYLANPLRHNDSESKAIKVVKATRIPKQHRHYENHDDALKDFQNINKGTSLTPYEYYHGVLAYMDHYDNLWEEFIKRIHSVIQKYKSSFVNRRGGRRTGRDTEHIHLRDDYAIFLRFAKREKGFINYKVSSTKIAKVDIRKIVEGNLRELLKGSNIDEMNKVLNNLERLVDGQTALIRDIWVNKLNEDVGTSSNLSLYRWLLHCAIWKTNNNIPHDPWELFLEKALHYSNGTTSFPQVSNGKTLRGGSANTGSLSDLRKIARIIDVDIFIYYDGEIKRINKSNKNLPGIDESHVLPFADYGEGETVPEPSLRNRSRGKAPMKGAPSQDRLFS